MKIAVIGSGISGNSAAWALSQKHEVTLYERRKRPGGHSATVTVDYQGTPVTVDTGFIVFNRGNYPNMCAMLEHLDVPTETTSMSFSVSLDDGALEWCGDNLRTIFAQKRNLFSPRFLFMLKDILRFNARAKHDLETGALCGLTFGDYIVKRRISPVLRDQYIVPMIAAIWSTPSARMLDYPAESLIRFLDNHRLIQLEKPYWETISGGSKIYVERLLKAFKGRLFLNAEVVRIERNKGRSTVVDSTGQSQTYDHVVIAAHSDQALAMLADPTDAERSILGAVQYRPNHVWLHRDASLMPKRRDAWAAWNYLGTREEASKHEISVSYWMNRLQNLDPRRPLFITLNPTRQPKPELTFRRFSYSHPQFDLAALDAQRALAKIQGVNNTWYCGAWTRYGFHEDGLTSGLEVARLLGCEAPWSKSLPTASPNTVMLEAAE